MTLTIDIQLGTPSEPARKFDGWRVKHKVEGGRDTPPGMPEVTPPLDYRPVEMTRAIQEMSFELANSANSEMNAKRWTAVHDHDRAFTNFQGFAKPGDPRANFVLGENLTSPLPKYDKVQRVCGGSFIHGYVSGDKLTCVPGVHGIDANAPMPSLDTILKNNWFIYAVSTGINDESIISHFPQGQGGPVLIPFIFSQVITFPLTYFERWQSDTLPDPLRVY